MNIEIKPGPALGFAPAGAALDPPHAAQDPRCAGLERERDAMRERWTRAEAEIANVRSRARRDVEDARNNAIQSFAVGVVEATENLHRGAASLPPRSGQEPEIVTRLREGFDSVERSIVGLLARNGIDRHDPTGTAFDPARHQAMDQRASTEHPPGTVLQAWTSGWTLNGRLLCPAMVVVSTSPPSAARPSPYAPRR